MGMVPEGAARSADGRWFWDGAQWQVIAPDDPGDPHSTCAVASMTVAPEIGFDAELGDPVPAPAAGLSG